MTTDATNTETTTQSVDTENKGSGMTLEQALEKINALQSNFQEVVSERDKTKQKLRKLEQDAGSATEISKKYDEVFAEKNKLIEQFETVNGELSSMKEGIRNQTVSQALTTALEAAGAKSISTVLKLVDKSKVQLDEQGQINPESLAALVKEVQESDPILFGVPEVKKSEQTNTNSGASTSVPAVKRAGETSTEGAYDKEMKSCKSPQEIQAVLRKYGKM